MESLVDVAEAFPSIIRSDLYACILNTFCSILASGAFQSNVVPQAFPTFKRFLRSITSSGKSQDVARLVRGCLWQFLRILRHAYRSDTDFALPCAKNTLLAITILLTSVGITLPANEELVSQALEEILGCLRDVGLAAVATNCLRSLLLTASKTTSDEGIFRYLLPRLLHFLNDTSLEDASKVRVVISHILASTVKFVPPETRSVLSAMVVPALLKHAALEGPTVHQETAAGLLEIVGADQAGFRSLIGQMSGEQRGFLESILRYQRGQGRQDHVETDQVDVKPSIALRMDF